MSKLKTSTFSTVSGEVSFASNETKVVVSQSIKKCDVHTQTYLLGDDRLQKIYTRVNARLRNILDPKVMASATLKKEERETI